MTRKKRTLLFIKKAISKAVTTPRAEETKGRSWIH